jgi:hypothetical protein
MGLFKLLTERAGDVADFAAPIITLSNPFAGILVKVVGDAVEKIDDESQSDAERQQLTLKFAAYLMRIGAALTEAAADGQITAEEFAEIRDEVAKFPDA